MVGSSSFYSRTPLQNTYTFPPATRLPNLSSKNQPSLTQPSLIIWILPPETKGGSEAQTTTKKPNQPPVLGCVYFDYSQTNTSTLIQPDVGFGHDGLRFHQIHLSNLMTPTLMTTHSVTLLPIRWTPTSLPPKTPSFNQQS